MPDGPQRGEAGVSRAAVADHLHAAATIRGRGPGVFPPAVERGLGRGDARAAADEMEFGGRLPRLATIRLLDQWTSPVRPSMAPSTAPLARPQTGPLAGETHCGAAGS